MEHEDKTQNFLHENFPEFSLQQQNQQNLFENLQNASGFGAGGVSVGGIGEEIAVNLGGKFEDEEHDEEWKYINEVQQSEKQTLKKVGEEIVGDGVGVVGQLLDIAETEVEAVTDKLQAMLLDTEELNEIHNSPSSIEESSMATTTNTNNNSSSENCEENLPPQREHETTTAVAPQLGFGDFLVSSSSAFDDHDEYKLHEKEQANVAADEEEDKENADPAGNDPLDDIALAELEQRPSDLDLADMHSNLNPEAKEFVPTFSNPTTPTSPKTEGVFLNFAGEGQQPQQAPPTSTTDNEQIEAVTECRDVDDFNVGEPVHVVDPTSPHPIAVPRHLLSNVEAVDDFVAESPRKGRGADMDAISLPAENEFDDGADKRPHELAEEIETLEVQGNITPTKSEDRTDFQQATAPVSLIDHGPETSVDLDLEADINDEDDVMRKSIYVENQIESEQHPIEDLLNTVQPIPTDSDSINNSFAEDYHQQEQQQQLDDILNKELLNVEEKEVISHSPSTEELQMQFQTNDFSSSSKDIPAIPIDLDNAKDMQESIYLEHTSTENANVETPRLAEDPIPITVELDIPSQSPLPEQEPHQQQVQLDESLLLDTSCSLINESSFVEREPTFTTTDAIADLTSAVAPENLLFTDFTNEKVVTELVTPSPHSTEEKHLFEETKENENTNGLNELEQQMTELLINQNDGKLPNVVEVEQTSTPIIERAALDPYSTYTVETGVSGNVTDAMLSAYEPQQLQPLNLSEIEEISIEEPASKPAEEIATVAAISAAVTTAAVAVAAITDSKKPEPIKKPTTTGKVASSATKSKVGTNDTKKVTEAKKPTTAVSATKSSTVSSAPSRPRTAPVKTAIEKKTTTATKPIAAGTTTTTTVRKHVAATSATAAKPAVKTTGTTTTTRTTTIGGAPKTTGATGGAIRNGARTTATRPATATAATTARKLATTASKPRPATAGATASAPPTKPNTLGINVAANKPARASLSPRGTLTSQLRKTGPTTNASNTNATAAAKSPMKPTTNGIAGKVASTTTNSSTTSAGNRKTTTTTTTTKTFSARPAPKTTTSTTATTTTRRSQTGTNSAVGSNSLSAPTTASTMRKSLSPSKRSTTSSSTASGKLSPTKAANARNNTTKDTPKSTKTMKTITTTTTTIVGASGDHATSLTAEMLKGKQQQFNANIMGVLPSQANGGGGDADNQIILEHIGNGGTHHDHGENGHLIEQGEIAMM